jgi:hypothetical protein
MRRRIKVVTSKGRGSTGVRWKPWLLLAAVACPGMACRSTAPAGQPASLEQTIPQCDAALLPPGDTITYTVSCDGFSPALGKVRPQGKLTFVSACDDEVIVSFSNPAGLFKSGAGAIVLKNRGEEKTETVEGAGGCHRVCFGSKTCSPDGQDSKTGSLDVYTSDPGPDLSKGQHP